MTPLKLRMIEDLQVRNLSMNTQTSYLEQVSGSYATSVSPLKNWVPRKFVPIRCT